MHSLKDFLYQSKEQLKFHDSYLKQYESLIAQGGLKRKSIKAQLKDVIGRMTTIVTPSFSEEELNKLGNLMHNSKVRSMATDLNDEIQKAKDAIEKIDTDSEYQQREVLIDPNVGEYTLEYNQLNPVYLKLKKEIQKYKKYEVTLVKLSASNYGTKEYKHTGFLKYFNKEHLYNWKHGDIICEEYGFDKFVDFREQYIKEHTEYNKVESAVNHYEGKIDYIKKMISNKEILSKEIPLWPTRYKEMLVRELELFFDSTSPQSAAAFFQNYPMLSTLAKTQQGLNHQKQYLHDFHKKLYTEKEELLAKRTRLHRERSRYLGRPSKYQYKTWTKAKFDKRFRRNTTWMDKRFVKYKKTQDTIYSYKDYENAPDNLSDAFWWRTITKEKVDGSFSPSVQEYYETHTHDEDDYQYEEVRNRSFSDNDNS